MTRACFAIACAVALGACEDEPRGYREPSEEVIRAPVVKVATLARDPATYDGQTVRVLGKVDHVLGPRAFVLADLGLLWAPKIPVVARAPVAPGKGPLARRDRVVVIGIVHARITPELVRELGGELAPDAAGALGSGPVLLARSIGRADP